MSTNARVISNDLAELHNAEDHINRVVTDQTERFEEALRLGAVLASAVDRVLAHPTDRQYRKNLAKALESYRTSESGRFVPQEPSE